jgi:hypothetical protein
VAPGGDKADALIPFGEPDVCRHPASLPLDIPAATEDNGARPDPERMRRAAPQGGLRRYAGAAGSA